jgi:hypothetical protein
MYPFSNPFVWHETAADLVMKQWQQWFQAQSAAMFLPGGPARKEESGMLEEAARLEERLDWLDQKVTDIAVQEPRLIYLEHELAALRSELSELKKTVSTGSAAPSATVPKPRSKTSRAKTAKDEPIAEN